MTIFSYKLDHDFGLAPNPFWGTMTLAVCKGQIRSNKNLKKGDWIVGTGSKKLKMLDRIIYAMRVEEILPFDAYWNDPRFECKKPQMNGSLAQIYGDNFYHIVGGKVVQDVSTHSFDDNSPNPIHLKRDTNGKNVLLSNHFYYFGNEAPSVPRELLSICCNGRGYHYRDISEDVKIRFVEWIETTYECGIHGDPVNWKQYKRPEMVLPKDV